MRAKRGGSIRHVDVDTAFLIPIRRGFICARPEVSREYADFFGLESSSLCIYGLRQAGYESFGLIVDVDDVFICPAESGLVGLFMGH